jgi:RNA polymerase sigma-70 factor (ECF subfamily)
MAPASDGDEIQVAAAAHGDRTAFAWLYARYAPMIHGILLARVRRQDVEDLVQDVFVAALARLRDLRDPRAVGAWLAAIARNKAADRNRDAREVLELPADLPGPAGERAEVRQALDAIRGLPEAYRETLVLRFVEGMTGPEIAARTGLAPDSVRVNLFRGVRLLRQRLGLEVDDE